MAILSVQNVSKAYSAHALFEDLSITFQPNERVGLVGPNGAGKTTLLRILAKDETPDGGWVDRSNDARIAFLPQIDVFEREATAQSAILDALSHLSLEEHEPLVRARKMLRRLGFDDVDVRVSGNVDEERLQLLAQHFLLLQDVLGYLAGALAQLRHHRLARDPINRLERRDEARGYIERVRRDIVLIGRGQIDGDRLVCELDVLRPEDRTVRTRFQQAEEVVLDRHDPMKPAPGADR